MVREPPARATGLAPQVIVVAGPNGAGKSTVAPELLRDTFDVPAFVNADEIARGLSGFAPESAAIAAGRMMVRRLSELMVARSDFAFETTLSGQRTRRFVEQLFESGYDVHLVFLWLWSPEQALQRVRMREAAGGHGVPEADVRRRFDRGLRAFAEMHRSVATTWRAYDASATAPRLIARGARGRPVVIVDEQSWRELMNRAEAP